MKIVVRVKLTPQADQAAALSATLHEVNEAANWVSAVAFEHGVPREYELRKYAYAELRSRGPGGAGRPAHHQENPRRLYDAQGQHQGLVATCDVPEAEQYEPDGFIGVDLGIANIATTSTGYQAAGRGLNRHRKRQLNLRRKLQKKGTRSAKRLLKKRNRREQRHAANTNHIIAKTIVTEAERTSAGISLEALKGIRQRVRLRKPQRVALHSWAFAQLGDFIVYKAKRAGVPVVFIDPAYTSQQCCECGHIDSKNRASQALFTCRNCGVAAHADRNASRNIARKGEAVWNAGRESRVPATP